MTDLISRSALMKSFERRCLGACAFCTHAIYSPEEPKITCGLVQCAPAVDAEPVRHGRWGTYHITGYDGLHPTYTVPCLECSYEATFTHRFCPNCGAKMDAEVKE